MIRKQPMANNNRSNSNLINSATKRMRSIVDIFPGSSVIADVGCDHGKISALLLICGKADKVIATDISPSSVIKAKQLVDELGLNIDARVGNGLEPVGHNEADGLLLSGMGAELMVSIMSDDMEKTKSFSHIIVSPHNHPEKLRAFFNRSGFSIAEERIIYDAGKNTLFDEQPKLNRFYIIMLALPNKSETEYDESELLFGRYWKTHHNEEYVLYLNQLAANTENIIRKSGTDLPLLQKKAAMIQRFISEIEK